MLADMGAIIKSIKRLYPSIGGSDYMEKKISKSEQFIETYNRLRNGEKVKCDACNKGYLVTPYDYRISHYFECSYCKAKLHID